jgi:hypothetical protein
LHRDHRAKRGRDKAPCPAAPDLADAQRRILIGQNDDPCFGGIIPAYSPKSDRSGCVRLKVL